MNSRSCKCVTKRKSKYVVGTVVTSASTKGGVMRSRLARNVIGSSRFTGTFGAATGLSRTGNSRRAASSGKGLVTRFGAGKGMKMLFGNM